jgi:hypothetical protein
MRLEHIHFGMAEAMFAHRRGGVEGMGGGGQRQHMIVGGKWRKWSMSQVQLEEGCAKLIRINKVM